MSIFNTANTLASELVRGTYYQTNEPCLKVERIVFYRDGHPDDKITITRDGAEWASVANEIELLLLHGYQFKVLPCPHCGATEFDCDHHHDLLNCAAVENVEAL
jgi:hypothetical protein